MKLMIALFAFVLLLCGCETTSTTGQTSSTSTTTQTTQTVQNAQRSPPSTMYGRGSMH